MQIREGTKQEREPYGKDCVLFIVEDDGKEVGRGAFQIHCGRFFVHDVKCSGSPFTFAMLFQRFRDEATKMGFEDIDFHVDRPGDLEPFVDSLISKGLAREQRYVVMKVMRSK